jgi:hypothetical protein
MFQDGKLKVRDHWYKGNLRDLSKAVGLEAEYDILQAQLSGAVHASAYALKEETHVKDFLLLDWAWRFSFRVLGKFAAFAGIELSELERDLIRSCEANIFNLHGT